MAGSPAFDRFLDRLPAGTELYSSVIVEGEVRFGLARLPDSRRRRALTSAFERVLADLKGVLPATRDVASRYGVLKAALWKMGKPIGENEIWLAPASPTISPC